MVAERRIEGWVASHPLVSMPSLLVTHTGASVLQDDAHHRIGVEILSESLRWSRKESWGKSESFGGVLVSCQM